METIPEDVLSKHSWNVALTWGRIISTLNLSDDAILMEIAPGHSPKVGIGLFQAHPRFRGTLYVVEPDLQALAKITVDYGRLFPNAKIIGHSVTLTSLPTLLLVNGSLDVVLANHPMDDMIIGRDFAAGYLDIYMDYFTGMYQEGASEVEKLAEEARAWYDLEYTRPHDCALYKREVLADWVSMLELIRPRFLAISQYESRTLKEYGLKAPDRLAYDVLTELALQVPVMSDETERILTESGFDPKRWIVSKLL